MGNKENVLRKGVDRTIHVFENIVTKLPDYKLYIIGRPFPTLTYNFTF
jgi:hypothetical protein